MSVPKLRFKADDGSEFPEWEEVELGKILNEYTEMREKDGIYDHASLTKEGVVLKTERFNRDFLVKNDSKKYRVTHLNDICYNPANLKFGVICRNKLGDVIFSPIYITFKVNLSNDPIFIEYLVTRPDFINYALRYEEGTVYERMAVKPEDLLSIVVKVPCRAEQQKIAACLSTLDSVIEHTTSEIAAWEKQKSGVMQLLFSRKVRFKADDGSDFPAWEVKKLSEITSMHARIGWQNLRKEEFLDQGDYLLITGTDFIDGKVNYKTCHYISKGRYDQDKNIQVEDGTILVTKDGTLGKVALIKGLDMPATLNAGVFAIKPLDDSILPEFLYYWLSAPMLLQYASEKSTGGTIKHLNQNILVDFPVSIPCLKEQQKIAACLSAFDDVIDMTKKELEAYRELKKGLLQQMFV